jgi:hypothetical protein
MPPPTNPALAPQNTTPDDRHAAHHPSERSGRGGPLVDKALVNTSPTFPKAYAFFWALVMLTGAVLAAAVALLFIAISLGTFAPHGAKTSGWEVGATNLAALGLLGMSIYAGIRAYRSVRHRGLRSPYPILGIILAGIGLHYLMAFF